MKKNILLVLLNIIFVSCFSQVTGYNLLLKTDSVISKIQTIEYSVNIKTEHKSQNTKSDGIVFFDFTSVDTLISCKYHFLYKNLKKYGRCEGVFNGSDDYFINWNDSTVKISQFKNSFRYNKSLKNNEFMYCSFAFLKEIMPFFIEQYSRQNLECSVNDTIINGNTFYNLNLKVFNWYYRDFEMVKTPKPNECITMFDVVIGKRDFLPVQIKHTHIKGNAVKTAKFTNVKINSVNHPDSIWNSLSLPPYLKQINPNIKKVKTNQNISDIGLNISDWKLQSLYGDTIFFNKLPGKLVLFDFWWIGCGPCIKVVPYLNDLYNTYNSKGLEVIGIDLRDKQQQLLVDYVKRFNMQYRIVWQADKVGEYFGVNAAPSFFLVDKTGKILFTGKGGGEENETKLRNIIDDLLAN